MWGEIAKWFFGSGLATEIIRKYLIESEEEKKVETRVIMAEPVPELQITEDETKPEPIVIEDIPTLVKTNVNIAEYFRWNSSKSGCVYKIGDTHNHDGSPRTVQQGAGRPVLLLDPYLPRPDHIAIVGKKGSVRAYYDGLANPDRGQLRHHYRWAETTKQIRKKIGKGSAKLVYEFQGEKVELLLHRGLNIRHE